MRSLVMRMSCEDRKSAYQEFLPHVRLSANPLEMFSFLTIALLRFA